MVLQTLYLKGATDMNNDMLFFGAIAFYLCAVLVSYKLFGRTGLYAYTVISVILANIQVCKNVDIFGLATTAGNVLYAASFLVTDILSEKYGKPAAKKAVHLGIFTTVVFMIGVQGLLWFVPNETDIMSTAMDQLFGLVPRVALASIVGYACSQTVDVALYHMIWNKSGGNKKHLWLRNCGSTFLSQAVDTVVFTSIAFYGVYPNPVFFSILWTTYFFKVLVAIFDTPFAYLARKMTVREE